MEVFYFSILRKWVMYIIFLGFFVYIGDKQDPPFNSCNEIETVSSALYLFKQLTVELYHLHVPLLIPSENGRHFTTRPLVSLWNDVREMGAEIPCWLHVTTQILAMSCHQYEISALYCQTSPREETNDQWRHEMSAVFSGYIAYSSNIFSFTIFSEWLSIILLRVFKVTQMTVIAFQTMFFSPWGK